MLILSLISILVGVVFGMRFTVLVVAPVTCGALAIAIVDGIPRGTGLWQLTFALIVIGISIQLGYILGIVAQDVVNSARGTNNKPVSLPRSWFA
jgi:hypothetical protein